MPVIIDEQTINKDYTVVRYLDTAKFISLLLRWQIFLYRADHFEDKFEGTIPQGNYEQLEKTFSQWRATGLFDFGNLKDAEIAERARTHYSPFIANKEKTYLNCWNEWEAESYGLWKIYGDQGKGIMIKSSLEKIKKSFEGQKHKIFASKVSYIDYGSSTIETVTPFRNLTVKHRAYHYENEIRLIHMYDDNDGPYDSKSNDPDKSIGIYLDCDIQSLVEEITIGPFAPNWYFDIVEDVCKKYKLGVKISKSELT